VKFKFSIILFFPLLLIFLKCQKAPDFSAIPVISNIKLNTSSITASANDSLKISFDFTDGDGDLGYQQGQNTNNDTTIFVTDKRVGKTDYTYVFDMPYISPKGSYKQISGTFTVYMKSNTGGNNINEVNCRPDAAHTLADTVHYTLKIRDRAGHLSNTLTSPNVYLNCQ
jgi:hypothetical protein